MGNSHITNFVRSGRGSGVGGQGGGGSTWAHGQIGLAYAKYLSPEFHLWCNQAIRTFMEGKLANVADIDGLTGLGRRRVMF